MFFMRVLLFLLSVGHCLLDFTNVTIQAKRRLSIIHSLVAPFMPKIELAGQYTCVENVRRMLLARFEEINTATLNFEELCTTALTRKEIFEALKLDAALPLRPACYEGYMNIYADDIVGRKKSLCKLFNDESSSASSINSLLAVSSFFAVLIFAAI